MSIVAKRLVGSRYQDATWHGGRPRPRRLCVRWGPIYGVKPLKTSIVGALGIFKPNLPIARGPLVPSASF